MCYHTATTVDENSHGQNMMFEVLFSFVSVFLLLQQAGKAGKNIPIAHNLFATFGNSLSLLPAATRLLGPCSKTFFTTQRGHDQIELLAAVLVPRALSSFGLAPAVCLTDE